MYQKKYYCGYCNHEVNPGDYSCDNCHRVIWCHRCLGFGKHQEFDIKKYLRAYDNFKSYVVCPHCHGEKLDPILTKSRTVETADPDRKCEKCHRELHRLDHKCPGCGFDLHQQTIIGTCDISHFENNTKLKKCHNCGKWVCRRHQYNDWRLCEGCF